MRISFEPQLKIGQIAISKTPVSLKGKDEIDDLLAALLYLFNNQEFKNTLFSILDKHLNTSRNISSHKVGRKGLTLWQIFVLSELRLCLNIDYGKLHNLVNNHHALRVLLGIEYEFGYERIELEYQNIYDNVNLLTPSMLEEINDLMVCIGHGIFKKKEAAGLHLKTDSFVVKSNVHYPTDYNLLWDCIRVLLRIIAKLKRQDIQIVGWRKLNSWHKSLKSLMRTVGQSSKQGGKNKEKALFRSVTRYLDASNRLLQKLKSTRDEITGQRFDIQELAMLDEFILLMEKHMDLLKRRVLESEKIPHEEKLFSVFEQYTQYITKGKFNPSVEFGKPIAITTDQFHLILQYKIYGKGQTDSGILLAEKDRILEKYADVLILSWSVDKGFWNPDNKKELEGCVQQVVMPRKGKCNQAQAEEESGKPFKKLRMKHSAVESNINELEHCGLNRCPDRSEMHFDRYVGMAVIAYNLRRIGHQVRREQLLDLEKVKKKALRKAA